MQCFIYKSFKKQDLYLYCVKKDDFSSLPLSLYESIGEPEFVMQLELTAERKLAHAEAKKVIAQLLDKGFYIQLPPTHFTLLTRQQ
jgi:uncharacterized protein YcgL (UPF0745 family)